MTATLELSKEAMKRLQAEAARQNIPVDAVLETLIVRHLPEPQNTEEVASLHRLIALGSAKGILLRIAPDFDAPVSDFEDYQ